MNKSKKKKTKVVIESIGRPAPDELVDAAKRLSEILDRVAPDEDDSLLDEPINNFRDAFGFVKKTNEIAIGQLQQVVEIINSFLNENPNSELGEEKLIELSLIAEYAAQSVVGLDALLSNLSNDFLPAAFRMIVEKETITYGALLDTKAEE